MRTMTLLFALGALLSPGLAVAGPCSEQIAELSRLTSGGASPATTGGITNPGAATVGGAAGMAAAKPGEASDTGTGKQSADQRSGTREMSAVAGQIATSPEDVRRQQEGRPTVAQAADQAATRLPAAKAKLDQARLLDEKGQAGCMGLVNEARSLLEAK
jgi:hypothetical protein